MLHRWFNMFVSARGEEKLAVSCPLHFTQRSRSRLLWKKMVSRVG